MTPIEEVTLGDPRRRDLKKVGREEMRDGTVRLWLEDQVVEGIVVCDVILPNYPKGPYPWYVATEKPISAAPGTEVRGGRYTIAEPPTINRPQKRATTQRGKKKMTTTTGRIFGHSLVSAIAIMGSKGMKVVDISAAVEAIGKTNYGPAAVTKRLEQIKNGRKVRGLDEFTAEQVQRLLSFKGKGSRFDELLTKGIVFLSEEGEWVAECPDGKNEIAFDSKHEARVWLAANPNPKSW